MMTYPSVLWDQVRIPCTGVVGQFCHSASWLAKKPCCWWVACSNDPQNASLQFTFNLVMGQWSEVSLVLISLWVLLLSSWGSSFLAFTLPHFSPGKQCHSTCCTLLPHKVRVWEIVMVGKSQMDCCITVSNHHRPVTQEQKQRAVIIFSPQTVDSLWQQ